MEKDLTEYTFDEFEAVPIVDPKDIGEFDSLVIIPTSKLHDSGYKIMDFVACRGNKLIGKLSGCSDVIHIGGIGGYNCGATSNFNPQAWMIDCLPCGLLRLINPGRKLSAGIPLSSFELFYK